MKTLPPSNSRRFLASAPVDFLSRVALALFAVSAVALLAARPVHAAPAGNLPTLDEALSFVDAQFSDASKRKPGDIISTSDVTPVFDGLAKLGWDVPNRKELLKRVPSDKDYVVQQLRTPAGRKFMQQICNLPLGYDRLFHLAKIPLGHQQVHDLIRRKDGYKMIEYMTTSQQGKNFGKQLSHTPNGANFNQPTGQIYTVAALKAELEQSYAETLKASAAAAAK